MRCLTPVFLAGELAKAKETYVRKFGEEPPEHPEGARWGGSDERARLLRAAIGRNSPLRTSETGTRLLGLRGEYATRFGVEPCGTMPWNGNGERCLLRLAELFEKSLGDNARRLVLETDELDRFDEAFLDGLGSDEFEDLKLDEAGRPVPPAKTAETKERG